MASLSSSRKRSAEDYESVEKLIKQHDQQQNDDRVIRNSLGMMQGLVVKDIVTNIRNLTSLLDEPDSQEVDNATDYLLNQIELNEEIHRGVTETLQFTMKSMKEKRRGVAGIKMF